MLKNRSHHILPKIESVRALLVYKAPQHHGPYPVGLGITAASTAKTLRSRGIWAETWPASSGVELAALLRKVIARADEAGEVRPTHVIIYAPWLSTEELEALATEFGEVVFVLMSHSNVGFLAADPHAIRLLRETVDLQLARHNVLVGGNSRKFTDWASAAWGANVVWLPNLYDLGSISARKDGSWQGGALRLGLFGANRTLKNFLTAGAAAVELAEALRVPTELHLSTGKDEGGDLRALEELTEGIPNFRVINAGWLPWPKFRCLVRKMHLVFQPSYTESFNNVTADAIAEGVPVVASDAIDWVPRWWQARADEPRDVARVAEQLLRDPNAARDGRVALENYVENGLGGWRDFLCPVVPSSNPA